MMRIAIAGSGGLARAFASYINETGNPFIILSRARQPQLEALNYQVQVVNYNEPSQLRYALRGIDLVISTVKGNPQINLIDAAARVGVQRFVPSEFEGQLSRRPLDDPLNPGSAGCIERLRGYVHHNSHPMEFTVFSCGVFYERFARGGLNSLGIGLTSNVYCQGTYLMDVGRNTAKVVEYTSTGRPVYISMTSVQDVARFVVAALDLGLDHWPREFTMQGDRLTVTDILRAAGSVKGVAEFYTEIIQARDLQSHLEIAVYYDEFPTVSYIRELQATADGRYDIPRTNLNSRVNFQPSSFWTWLTHEWGAS